MKWIERAMSVTIACWAVRELYRAAKEIDWGNEK